MGLVCIQTFLFLFYIGVGIYCMDSEGLMHEGGAESNIFDWNDSQPLHINDILYSNLEANHHSSDGTNLSEDVQSTSVLSSGHPPAPCKDQMSTLVESDLGPYLKILETYFNHENSNSLGQNVEANPNTNIVSFLPNYPTHQSSSFQSQIDDQNTFQNPTANKAITLEIAMSTVSKIQPSTKLHAPAINHLNTSRKPVFKHLIGPQSDSNSKNRKRIKMNQALSKNVIQIPEIVTRSDDASKTPQISQSSSIMYNDAVSNRLEYSPSNPSEIYKINRHKMGNILHTKIIPSSQNMRGVDDVLKFNEEVFQNHEYESILDQSNSEAMIWLIKEIQPELGHLYISSETPEEVHEIFTNFDRKAILIRCDKIKCIKRLEIKSNPQEKSQMNHQIKSKAKTQEEGRLANHQAKRKRKSLEDKSVDKLFNNRFLWYSFWHKRTGIKIKENHSQFQERLVLFLLYIDVISTILGKYMTDDFSGLRYDSKILLQKAIDIVSQHYDLSFQTEPKSNILNYKTRRIPYDEVPKTYRPHRQEWIWIWTKRLLDEIKNQKLKKIFFETNDGTISRQSKSFFNRIFFHSIDKLNERLSRNFKPMHSH
ncbi:hypothetical protein PGTUg99_003087 [Puccinia graminis f. sp. tritici]|uniref:Golgi to ER traffic-protein n=1 Tax=Puccinia graminis f. sp. tritici TaxID=56615 RepID=A0A5B0QL02_PUCGR|nr:hypothetical protein PGTUg99_003087 [Puccinia graminis f. sp. tritici]